MKELDYKPLIGTFVKNRSNLVGFLIKRGADLGEAEDAAQQAFVSAYNNFSSFREYSGIKTWLYKIAANELYKSRSREARRREIREERRMEIKDNTAIAQIDPSREVEENESRVNIYEQVTRLHPKFQDALDLLLEGKRYADIASALNIPIGTVKSRVFRAKRELQSLLL